MVAGGVTQTERFAIRVRLIFRQAELRVCTGAGRGLPPRPGAAACLALRPQTLTALADDAVTLLLVLLLILRNLRGG